MKIHWSINVLLYLVGIAASGLLLIFVVYLVYVYAIKGYNFGEEFSQNMIAERPSREVEFILDEDTSAAEAAKMLEELGVIKNQYLFRLELFLKDSSTVYKAGTYDLNQNMSNTDINRTLRTAPAVVIPDSVITIYEGYSVRDIAMYLEAREIMFAEEFLEACETLDLPFGFISDIPEGRKNRLEGYLFPDTYFISGNPTAYEIINKMLTRFDEIFTGEYRNRAEELGLTMDQVVTMASVIEKEVRVAEERPKVSEIIYNRLKIDMPLQMCSTVLYVLDTKRERLLLSDLEVKSPYNTYIQGGLPIGPIANPGAECIKAALYPDGGQFLYMVLQNDETGEHYFTADYDAFVNAKARYNREF